MPVLVVAPHPDDEVLGVGGTMARLAGEGERVTVAVVTRGEAGMFDPEMIERGREEARLAHRLLGVGETLFLDLPAARLDQLPHHEVNAAMQRLVDGQRPTMCFLPFRGDIHRDHQIVFDSMLVAVRPSRGTFVPEIYAYETLSETNWNAPRGITPPFVPDCFIRIDDQLDRKLDAMRLYASQLQRFPHERSVEALEALARHRGATIGAAAAEAFMTIRRVL